MTKREALRECRKMWLWLAKNPGRKKCDYPGSRMWSNFCPCCEYASRHCSDVIGLMRFCSKVCPLKKLWPRGCEIGGRYGKWKRSPWERWRSNPRDSAAALEIADACIDRRKR